MALAQTASAAAVAEDGPVTVVEGNLNGGPEMFVILENGQRVPVFYCDADNLNMQHTICEAPVVADSPRF